MELLIDINCRLQTKVIVLLSTDWIQNFRFHAIQGKPFRLSVVIDISVNQNIRSMIWTDIGHWHAESLQFCGMRDMRVYKSDGAAPEKKTDDEILNLK